MPKLLAVLIVLLTFTIGLSAQAKAKCMVLDKKTGKRKCAKATSWKNCPRLGSGADTKLSFAKNRTDQPDPSEVADKTIPEIVAVGMPAHWKPLSDRGPLTGMIEGKPFRVKLYVMHITSYPDGAEACNCNINGERNNDFHIVLVTKPKDPEKKSLTAEISPRIRPDGWTIAKLRKLQRTTKKPGAYVRITGWALLDTQHIGKATPVRATHWEIHPVTKFEVCTSTVASCDSGTGWTALEDMP